MAFGSGFAEVGVRAVVKGFAPYMAQIDRMEKKTQGFGAKIGPALKTAALGGAAAIAALGVISVKSFASFDSAMTKSLAIMGDVSDEMEGRMSDAARNVAKTTTFAASEAAEAYFFLASAGLDAAASVEVMPKVAAFAQAGMFDLATATDLLTDAQSALGLAIRDDAVANMENMVKISDVLVKANTLANATVQQFSESLTTEAGAALKAFNIDVEEGVAVLAAFADQGVKGQIAGTGLSRILRLMTSAAVENSKAYDELGVRVFDAQGNINNLADIIGDLEIALGDMSDAERVAALESLGFQARVQGVILPLLGSADAIRNYEKELRKAAGITDEIATKQLESFSAQLTILRHKIEDMFIIIGSKLVPVLLWLMTVAEDAAVVIGEVVKETSLAADAAEKADASFSLWDATMAVVTVDASRFKKEVDDLAGKTDHLSAEIDAQLVILQAEAVALRETGKTTHDVAEETSEFDTQVAALAARLGISEQVLRDSGLSIEELREDTKELSAEVARAPATWQAFDQELAASAMIQAELEGVMGNTGAGAAQLSGDIDSLAASLRGASSANAELMSTLGAITGQRTRETNALDIQINALELEQNAALQAEVGQESLGGAVSSATDALGRQISALNNLAASMVPQALNDEIIALEREAQVLQLATAEIEDQILQRQRLIDAHQDEVGAIREEVVALDQLLGRLRSTAEGLDEQIKKEKELAAERAGFLPHDIKIVNLELEKAKLLEKVGGKTEALTEAEAERLEEIEAAIKAEQSSINVKKLEAKATELQAEASGEHLRALEDERAEVQEQITATEALKSERERYIDTLHPPELIAEIERLRDHKQNLDDDMAATGNLKSQRELYIKTLVPVELLQDIDALGRQKTALDNSKTGAEGATGAVKTLSSVIGDNIRKLDLERERIDLVTEGWRLQAEAMLDLPTVGSIGKGLKELLLAYALILKAEAIAAGDFEKLLEVATFQGEVMAWQPAQHGWHGEVDRPTMFLAGEAGRERVDISPLAPSVIRDIVLAPSVPATIPGLDQLAQALGETGGMSVSVSAASQEQIAAEVAAALRGMAFDMGRN